MTVPDYIDPALYDIILLTRPKPLKNNKLIILRK